MNMTCQQVHHPWVGLHSIFLSFFFLNHLQLQQSTFLSVPIFYSLYDEWLHPPQLPCSREKELEGGGESTPLRLFSPRSLHLGVVLLSLKE